MDHKRIYEFCINCSLHVDVYKHDTDARLWEHIW